MDAWLAALMNPSEEAVEAACAPNVVIERYGIFEGRDAVAERIEGRAAVLAWLRRSPEGVAWSVTAEGERWRYRIEIEGFVNHGWWDATLEDGLLARLEHRADAIDQTMPTVEEITGG